MGDINIERKPKNIWPWLAGLVALILVVLALVWLFATPEGQELLPDQQDTQEETTPPPGPPPGGSPSG